MLCAHTRECYMRTSYFICVRKFSACTKSFVHVHNSLYEYNKLCTSPYLGGGGGGLASYFINTVL